MRILAVAPSLPYPADHGQRLRTWGFLERLARTDSVTLATWREPGTPDEHVEAVLDVVGDVVLADVSPVRLGPIARLQRQAAFLAGGPPPYVQQLVEERWRSFAPVGRAIRERHEADPYDVVVLEDEGVSRFRLPDLGVPVVQHRLQVFSRVLADERRRSLAGRAAWLVEARGWRRYDRTASARAALSVATTPESAEALRELLPADAPVVAVTNGVGMRRLRTPPSGGTDVALIGWMGYPPNADAARWFATAVWPIVRRDHPEATFRVVGREPAADVLALHDPARGVVVTGEVPDVADACEGVRAGVAPLRAGMGIKNKVLELMSMGVPVVATPAGAEGNPAGEHDGLLRVPADDPGALAASVSALLADPARADALGGAARRFVDERFSWDALAAELRAHLDAVAARRDGGEPPPEGEEP